MEHTAFLLNVRSLIAMASLAAVLPVVAQPLDRIYRCGNEYTNNPSQSQLKGCVALQGGNVTVVQGGRVANKANPANAAKPPNASASAATSPSQVDPQVQKSRDSDARTILSNELRRAEAQLADAQREYQGGKPALRADETPTSAAYAQRVADLKLHVARAEADVAGIRRELQRAGGAVPAPTGPAMAAGSASATGSGGSPVVAR